MPELVTYKVRVEVEYTVVGVEGYGEAVACAEEKIGPALKIERTELGPTYARDAKILSIAADRR